MTKLDRFPEEDTSPERKLTVTYDGTTVKLPDAEAGLTVASLYRQFKRVGGKDFEVRDSSGRLIAVGSRVSSVPAENESPHLGFDLSEES